MPSLCYHRPRDPPPRKTIIKAHDESESRCVKADASSETPFDAANTPSKAWRWGSVAELARGGAIQEQVAPGQDKSTQDNLYAAALSHFVRAARHAVAAQSYPELVVRSAEAMWNCSLHLSGSSVSRRLARSSLRCILACMRESGIVSCRFIASRGEPPGLTPGVLHGRRPLPGRLILRRSSFERSEREETVVRTTRNPQKKC